MFTAVSGSAGAQLRFSSASATQIAADPGNFVRALRHVDIPPDCMFTVRFGGDTWHQFASRSRKPRHPVLFALSCHTDELGGDLTPAARAAILANQADIPLLTEVLPAAVSRLLQAPDFDAGAVPTTALSLDAAPGTLLRLACDGARAGAEFLRGAWGAWRAGGGILSYAGARRSVSALGAPRPDSLLRRQLGHTRVHHEDTFCLLLSGADFKDASAKHLLAAVLEGFLRNPPGGVSTLMALRNALVRPFGLRTSPLGCPVSSLLSAERATLFGGRYPVFEQAVNGADTRAQVVLGANDKHLLFRSCVGVEIVDRHHLAITLGTRVHCKNLFGRVYMGAIERLHRRYIAPAMLRLAVEFALPGVEDFAALAAPAPA